MCMKNLNAIITTCTDVNNYDNGTQNLIGIFDSISPIKRDGSYCIENLYVVVNFTIIYSHDETKDEFKLNHNYDFMVRLTHVESGCAIDLSKFDLNLHESQLTTWCKDFYEFKHTIKIPYIYLPKGIGNYALKLLVKEEQSPTWTVQSIAKIVVGEVCQ